jgi:hypothetical protein
MVQRLKQGAAIGERPQAVEAHGIQPLEDVAVFPVLRSATVLLDKPLDFLEPGDDALLARRASALGFRRGELGKFRRQFVEVGVTHTDPPS